ncbi:MAG: hypothetical protein K2L45_08110 [Muribaculaceae bacterium]|nr:hypothetical protein [Muribaculaceae bacterium]
MKILTPSRPSSRRMVCPTSKSLATLARRAVLPDNRPASQCIAECIGYDYADRPRPDGPLSP